MFRTKITAKSVSHSNCFSPLLQKKAYNLWTKPFKRNLWCSLLDRYYLVLVSDCRFGVSPVNYPDPDPDRISNFWYAKYYLILSWNVVQLLLNLNFSKTRNKPVLLKPHLLEFLFKKQIAQRATIAHLSPMCQHPFISNKPASKVIKNLTCFQIREQMFFQGLVPPMSAVWTCQKSNLL